MLIGLGVFAFFIAPALALGEILRCTYLECRRDRIPILLYHRLISRRAVREGRLPDREPIYTAYDDVFAAQMLHLKDNGHTTLTLDEFSDIRRGKRPQPARGVVITFDDGYLSNHTLAWPILRRNAQKATIFVSLEPDTHTRERVAGIDGFLTQDQMREMDRGGVAIESHTVTHRILSELDDETATRELTESKRRIGEILGRTVRHLAIPRSGYNRRIRRLAMAAGYETVCCNNKGSSNGLSSLRALPRIVIERDMSLDDFARALSPRGAIILRLIGNLKRLPAALFGPTAATRIRDRLYGGPLAPLFRTHRLKQVIGGGVLAYLLGIAAFTWYLVCR
ncbi:MAG TPA: polysaccharide deacetylase family protein [Candidatus Polarisedimenticolia bacterium]|nr:polysaccharide deacetylase family protein [Candidatus Polarisedimenticolia bacterium]